MRRTRLIEALRGEPTDTTPIWLMRQAGRHLPGYRALRERHSLLEIARTPELAARATLEPVRTYDVDAGVVFADLSLPFGALGVDFSIEANVGPVVGRPVRTRDDVQRLSHPSARESLGFVGRTIERFLELESERPIVGFSGAPFTLASYLIEGRPHRDLIATRRMLYTDPGAFDLLIERLAEVALDYLTMQARAGAAALQLFDTWVGALSAAAFRRHLREPLRRLFEALEPLERPTIYFSVASSHLLEEFAGLGASAISVDWRVPLGQVRRRLGDTLALQGNLDPAVLLGTPERVRAGARAVLEELPDHLGHVFNLGHGVLPATDPARVAELVNYVHAQGRLRR